MAEESKVTLHGFWSSPFSKRVELALKLKGISYEYVEEDLPNKSPELLKYNPVHKKVPVLVHMGKPIAEPLVILEYIDETWGKGPTLLPEDPYKRARARFWGSFLHQQIFETILTVIKTTGEVQQKGIKEFSEKLEMLEEGAKELFPEGSVSINNQNMGYVDIIMCSLFGPHLVHLEVFGLEGIDPQKTPLLHSWVMALRNLPVVRETMPSPERMLTHMKYVREKALKSLAA